MRCNCRKKAIANKKDCWSTFILIEQAHENLINCEPQLRNSDDFLGTFTNHNRGPFKWFIYARSLYHVMKDLHFFSWLRRHDPLEISTILTIPVKHNIIFAKFLEILFLCVHTFVDKTSEFTFHFFIKGTMSPKFFEKCTLKFQHT